MDNTEFAQDKAIEALLTCGFRIHKEPYLSAYMQIRFHALTVNADNVFTPWLIIPSLRRADRLLKTIGSLYLYAMGKIQARHMRPCILTGEIPASDTNARLWLNETSTSLLWGVFNPGDLKHLEQVATLAETQWEVLSAKPSIRRMGTILSTLWEEGS